MTISRFAARAALALGLATSALAVPALITPAAAAEKVSNAVGKILAEAQKLAEAKQFKQCAAKAKEADAVASKTAYDQFVINQMLGYCLSNSGDYNGAAKAYEALLNSGRLPAAEVPKHIKAVAVFSYQGKNYAKAIQFGKRYISEVGRDNDILLLIAQSYFIQGDNQNALVWIKDLINGQEKAGQRVSEDSYLLYLSAGVKVKDRAVIIDGLEKLVANYPATKYWNDLLNNLQGTPGLDNRTVLDVMRLKLATGVLNAEGHLEAAQIAIQLGLPGEAVTILDAGVKAGLIGGSERHQRLINLAKSEAATDKASLAGQEAEAKAEATGELYVRLGEAYLGYGNSAKAIELIGAGLTKGSLKNVSNARVQLGRAYLAAGRPADARKAFESVKGEGAYTRVAKYWIYYIRQNG